MNDKIKNFSFLLIGISNLVIAACLIYLILTDKIKLDNQNKIKKEISYQIPSSASQPNTLNVDEELIKKLKELASSSNQHFLQMLEDPAQRQILIDKIKDKINNDLKFPKTTTTTTTHKP